MIGRSNGSSVLHLPFNSLPLTYATAAKQSPLTSKICPSHISPYRSATEDTCTHLLFKSYCYYYYLKGPTAVVKLDPRDTPPPLHFSPLTSEQERSSTADTTPVGTPNTFDYNFRRRSDKERDKERESLPSYFRKSFGFAGNPTSYVDSALLESDVEDNTFPLFQDSTDSEPNMATRVTPVNIATSSNSLNPSRRHHTSNLTSALQSTSGNETRPTPSMSISNGRGPHNGATHRDSLSSGIAPSGSHCGSGAQPISMNSASRERPRRESLASSMVSGMSWGGVSVGSFIRDEYGTLQSPQCSLGRPAYNG